MKTESRCQDSPKVEKVINSSKCVPVEEFDESEENYSEEREIDISIFTLVRRCVWSTAALSSTTQPTGSSC